MTKPESADNSPELPEEEPEMEGGEEALELNSPANDELQKLLEDNAKLKDQLLRSLADAENTRRRARLDIEDAGKYAVVSFARDLIEVLENLARAEQNAPVTEGADPLLKNYIEGVRLTKKELLNAFEKQGIKRIDPMGEKFDHNFHQAIAQVDSDKEPGTVISVVQAGYVIRDRLLRPAMVAVAKAPEPKPETPAVDTEA